MNRFTTQLYTVVFFLVIASFCASLLVFAPPAYGQTDHDLNVTVDEYVTSSNDGGSTFTLDVVSGDLTQASAGPNGNHVVKEASGQTFDLTYQTNQWDMALSSEITSQPTELNVGADIESDPTNHLLIVPDGEPTRIRGQNGGEGQLNQSALNTTYGTEAFELPLDESLPSVDIVTDISKAEAELTGLYYGIAVHDLTDGVSGTITVQHTITSM